MNGLVRIAAPPGTGKTSVLPHLLDLARGRAIVADIDEILEDGALLGVRIAHPDAAASWPAYDRLWGRIAALVLRSGFPVVLLTQVPDAGDPGGRGTLLGWEVEGAVRRERLLGRGEDENLVLDAQEDAATLREMLPPERLVRTDADATPKDAAEQLWSAVAVHL